MSDDSVSRELAHIREVVSLRLDGLAERIKKLEDAAAAEAAERRNTRRWLIGAVAVPSMMMLLTLILTVWGPR